MENQKKEYFANVKKDDSVVCLLYGKGVHIRYRKNGTPANLPEFANQTLFYAGTQITIVPAPEPKREYVPRVGDVISRSDGHSPCVVTRVDDSQARCIFSNALGGSSDLVYYADAKLLATYSTWQEAVNSPEFNGVTK